MLSTKPAASQKSRQEGNGRLRSRSPDTGKRAPSGDQKRSSRTSTTRWQLLLPGLYLSACSCLVLVRQAKDASGSGVPLRGSGDLDVIWGWCFVTGPFEARRLRQGSQAGSLQVLDVHFVQSWSCASRGKRTGAILGAVAWSDTDVDTFELYIF